MRTSASRPHMCVRRNHIFVGSFRPYRYRKDDISFHDELNSVGDKTIPGRRLWTRRCSVSKGAFLAGRWLTEKKICHRMNIITAHLAAIANRSQPRYKCNVGIKQRVAIITSWKQNSITGVHFCSHDAPRFNTLDLDPLSRACIMEHYFFTETV